jgi:alpha-tubulin suppressor-like RCC1 family protein
MVECSRILPHREKENEMTRQNGYLLRHTLKALLVSVIFLGTLQSVIDAAPAPSLDPSLQGLDIPFTKVAAGGSFTLALKEDGSVWRSGDLGVPKLGNGQGQYATPIHVQELDHVIDISAGSSFAAAIRSDGTLWTAGYSSLGALGDLARKEVDHFVEVKDLYQIKQVEAGAQHVLALKKDGTVWSWGDNSYGQLGEPALRWYSPTPIHVRGEKGSGYFRNIVEVAAGDHISAALDRDGQVWMWGDDSYHLTESVGKSAPYPIPELKDVKAIAAGSRHLLALKRNGTVWSIGSNLRGELGDGTTLTREMPVQVKSESFGGYLTNVVAIDACFMSSAAVKKDGTVWTWGMADNNTLGLITSSDVTIPQYVSDIGGHGKLSGIKSISLGFDHAAAIDTNGSVIGWGSNYYGQLGNGTIESSYTPVTTLFPFIPKPQPPAEGKLRVVVNGKTHELATTPLNKNGSLMLSLRDIAPVLDAVVTWNQVGRKIEIRRDQTIIVLQANESSASMNGKRVALTQPPIIVNGQTFVPLRFISEAFGATVDWQSESNTIMIKIL